MTIQEVVPDAKVFLFGSRARGDWHDESDWDILVLTTKKVDRKLKSSIHEKLYPVSLKFGGEFINHIVLNEKDWNEHPSYYVLHTVIKNEMIAV